MSQVTIRSADAKLDAAACAELYAPYVEDGPISFEERAPSAAELAERIERTLTTHPWLVAERGGELVGYAYACPHRQRTAYRWSVDVSVYVAAGHVGEGIGRALYTALFERLRGQRFRMAYAGITLPNAASVALHEGLGFVQVGTMREVGWKLGEWRDVGWFQLELAPATTEPPPEPLLPEQELSR